MGEELGRAFAEALGHKDADALRRLLRPDVDFRAMTPQKFWESNDADHVIDEIFFGHWFEPDDVIKQIVAIETAPVSRRERVGYRLLVENPGGSHVIDQQAYLERDGERIGWLRVMCAGKLPVDGTAP